MTQSLPAGTPSPYAGYPALPYSGVPGAAPPGPGAVLAPSPGATPLIPDLTTNTQTGTLVTINTPSGPAQFEIPNYFALPVEIREAFFRTDTGVPGLFAVSTTGIPTQVVDQFRNLVTTGLIRPVNAAAAGFVASQGGWEAGDQTPLGPLINGLPGGLTSEQWQVVIGQTQQQIDLAESLGYFTGADGQPLPTLERQQAESQIASRAAQDAIARLLAENTVAQTQAQLSGMYQGNPTEAARQFNAQLALQQAQLSGMYQGNPTEAARQFNAQLALQQQQALAAASADPNRVIEANALATVLGASRGAQPALPLAYAAQGALAGAGSGSGGTGASGAGTGSQYQPVDIPVALSPESVAYLTAQQTGRPLPAFGNPSGVQGQQTTLGQIGGQTQTGAYSFRQTPGAYNALSPTGKAEVGAINLALTGQRPQDLEAEIKKQLPQPGGYVPAAYSL